MTAVREQLRKGAAVIKVCASGGVLSERDHPIHQQFTDAELRAIVEVAGMAERSVMAHCHGKPGMLAAIEAGVTTIEHGTYLDDEVVAAMRERDVLLVPTRLIVTELMAAGRTAGMSAAVFAKLEATDRLHEEALARAHEGGVRIAMGTDAALSRPTCPPPGATRVGSSR
jgi:imidazolonepropionase-like amidohydrolase